MAQNPSYFRVGEEAFAETDIYHIIQDEEGYMWFATDRALFRYDGYEFKPYKNKKATNSSLFALTFDNNGILYCHNLAGQIFRVIDDSLNLYYEIPPSIISSNLHYQFDDKNNLILSGNGLYSLGVNKKLQKIYERDWMEPPFLAKNKDSEILFGLNATDSIAYYKNGQIRWDTVAYLQWDYDAFLKCYESTIYTYEFSQNISTIEGDAQKHLHLKLSLKSHVQNLFVDYYGNIWIETKEHGIYLFDPTGKSNYHNKRILEDYNISAFYIDREQNIWLGTFDEGLLLISNLSISEYRGETKKSNSFHNMIRGKQDDLFVFDKNNYLYHFSNDKSFSKIADFSELPEIDFAAYIPFYQSVLFYSSQLSYVYSPYKNKIIHQFRYGDYKGISLINESTYIFTANKKKEVVFLKEEENDILLFNKVKKIKPYSKNITTNSFRKKRLIFQNKNRNYSVCYDKVKNEIWSGQAEGLFLLGENNTEQITYHGQQISAIDICIDKDTVWVASTNLGLIKIVNRKIETCILEKDGLLSNELKQMKLKDNYVYLSTLKGFQRYDIRNKKFDNFTPAQGAISRRIKDFELVNEDVWLTTSVGLQCFNFSSIKKNNVKPLLHIDAITINEVRQELKQNISLAYNENRIEILFRALAFRHRGNLRYEYRLFGLDEKWSTQLFENPKVKFSSLPPGDYTFELRAVNENNVASEIRTWSFVIQPPFTQTWTFVILCFLSITFLIMIIFMVRLRVIKRQLTLEKEIKASKVTAIKAQMNPHFVFNALNSIQDLILMADIRSSNIYLGKFADLMRKTLEYSERDFINLEEEIDLLNNYMELEKLRFEEDFNYQFDIRVDEDRMELIAIPSMILQPYIENAIKHGLLHKKGKKVLWIRFFIHQDVLVCEIEDNGVGREKSAEINSRRQKSHNSFASKANQNRLELINEVSKVKIELDILDLYSDDKVPLGTKVCIKFPI
jgi:hypothetical protein